jgi:transcriptional regulator with XRE-family HTH domain
VTPDRTRGADALSKRAAADVASATGASESTARRWMTGARVPSPAARKVLCEKFEIAVDAWTAAAPASKARTRATSRSPAAVKTKTAPPAPVGVSAADRVRQQVTMLEDELRDAKARGVGPRDLQAIHAPLTNALRLLARISGESETSESSIVRSRAWARIVSGFREALEKMPPDVRRVAAPILASTFKRMNEDGS